jgi:hypothetical protein
MLVAYTINLCAAVHGANLDPELYQRWVQFSLFSPVFWFHGLWGRRLPWEYGPEGIEAYRKFVGLRYRLLPYTYIPEASDPGRSIPVGLVPARSVISLTGKGEGGRSGDV